MPQTLVTDETIVDNQPIKINYHSVDGDQPGDIRDNSNKR